MGTDLSSRCTELLSNCSCIGNNVFISTIKETTRWSFWQHQRFDFKLRLMRQQSGPIGQVQPAGQRRTQNVDSQLLTWIKYGKFQKTNQKRIGYQLCAYSWGDINLDGVDSTKPLRVNHLLLFWNLLFWSFYNQVMNFDDDRAVSQQHCSTWQICGARQTETLRMFVQERTRRCKLAGCFSVTFNANISHLFEIYYSGRTCEKTTIILILRKRNRTPWQNWGLNPRLRRP